MVQGKIRSRIGFKNTRNGLLVENRRCLEESMTQEPVVPMSNFDLIDAASALAIKNFRGVFMRDQLPKQPKRVETGIINLDNSSGEGTHWVAYAIDPRGIVYFDSYGLAPPREFMRYISTMNHSAPIFYSTLPTEQLNDPPICGREVLNVLAEISKFPSKPPHLVVNEYTSGRLLENQ